MDTNGYSTGNNETTCGHIRGPKLYNLELYHLCPLNSRQGGFIGRLKPKITEEL